MIASIAVSAAVFAIDKPYSYQIPVSMDLKPGVRVVVPFGRGNRQSEGIVLDVRDGVDEGLKFIVSALDVTPVISEDQLRMAAFLRDRYFCTFYDAIKAMLPAGLWFSSEETFSLADTIVDSGNLEAQDPDAFRILSHISELGGQVKRSVLLAVEPDPDRLQHSIQVLKKKKLILSSLDYHRRIKDKSEQIASLCLSAEETMEYAMRKKRSAPLQYEVLRLLCTVGTGSVKEICYLTGATMATVRRLENLGYLSLSVQSVFRNSLPDSIEKADELLLNLSFLS